ncbi:MAG: hypothetical protein M1828_004127 [Chrysothrix sp. TS-e1954]|nr:MAG: hypothetical protein M1828_004127 [Chrysothrix sp. TS-e1954]
MATEFTNGSVLDSTFSNGIEVASEDPYSLTPGKTPPFQRHSSYDADLQSSYAEGSPSQAKRTLEAHISDTDRRIRDASKLGTTLLDQRQRLKDRLKDIDQQQGNEEIGADLKKKLVDLEKEYNEVGKESAKALLPKYQTSDGKGGGLLKGGQSSIPRASSATRKPHQPSGSRANDVELATEISTSLLGQVRHLQGVLHEKDEALRIAQTENAQLIANSDAHLQHMRGLDENEQKYKDENWTLETQVQDLTSQIREAAVREQRLTNSLTAIKSERTANDREHDELLQSHGRLTEDHTALRRQHDLDLSSMRRDISDGESERDGLQKKVEELISQNQDLAKAVAYRMHSDNEGKRGLESEITEPSAMDAMALEDSPPPSPTKATPRHGGLESETLKSSLNHAHRMIQNLKSNIHREKTEKIELKRMLQDARDEVEERRADGNGASTAGRRRKQDALKKPVRSSQLGASHGASQEIIDDPTWEEYNGSPGRLPRKADTSDTGNETSDGFETANERGNSTNTDTDAFMTGAESLAGDTDGDLTETEETSVNKMSSIPRLARNRASYLSTASDDGDDYDLTSTPPNQPRYRMKMNRGGSRELSSTPGANDSPASFASSVIPGGGRQNLADELDDLGDPSVASSTPSRLRDVSHESTPETAKTQDMLHRSSPVVKPEMVDSSTTMNAQETHQSTPTKSILATVGGAIFGGAATAGALEAVTGGRTSDDHKTKDAAVVPGPSEAASADRARMPRQPLSMSFISAQATEPVIEKPVPAPNTTAASQAAEGRPIQDASHDRSMSAASSTNNETPLAPSTQSFVGGIRSISGNPSRASTPATPPRVPSRAEGHEAHAYSNDIDSPAEPSSIGRISITPGRDISAKELNAIRRPGSSSSNASPRPLRNVLSSMNDSDTQKRSATSWQDSSRLIMHDDEDQENQFREPTLQFAGSGDVPDKFRPASSDLASSELSAAQFDELLKERRAQAALSGSTAPQQGSLAGRPSAPGSGTSPTVSRGVKRPMASGSLRDRAASPPRPSMPPLPSDHREVIAAAASRTSSMVNSSMPPPTTPATANRQLNPPPSSIRTSASNFGQSPLAHKTGSLRNRASSMTGRSDFTRRSSVSSFASELDERFNGSAMQSQPQQFDGFENSGADPRMIQAITQTMIGEFLWKYTRKAGRGQHSENRHKRFFWLHPYTRTLYWSNRDPSTAGRLELKAKSVQIEAVRVLGDENPIPPGLHTKSIVVVTPGRSIKFTAPSAQRHETWFNALSYLLLRNEADETPQAELNTGSFSTRAPSLRGGHRTSARTASIKHEDDLADFTPGGLSSGYPRRSTRLSSMPSARTSGVNSNKDNVPSYMQNRTSSPQASISPAGGGSPSLAVRQSEAARKRSLASGATAPSLLAKNTISESTPTSTPTRQPRQLDGSTPASTGTATPESASQSQTTPNASSLRSSTGRLSSLTSKLRAPSLTNLTKRARRQSRGPGEAGTKNEMPPPPVPATAPVQPQSGVSRISHSSAHSLHSSHGQSHSHSHTHGGSRGSRTSSLENAYQHEQSHEWDGAYDAGAGG